MKYICKSKADNHKVCGITSVGKLKFVLPGKTHKKSSCDIGWKQVPINGFHNHRQNERGIFNAHAKKPYLYFCSQCHESWIYTGQQIWKEKRKASFSSESDSERFSSPRKRIAF